MLDKQPREQPREQPSKQSAEIRKTLFMDELGSTPLEKKRQNWEDYAKSVPVSESVRSSETGVGGVPCLWLRPRNTPENYVLVYLHGGGLTEGSVFTAREWTARLAKQTSLSVLSVGYKLAPEYPYPAALHDVKNVYQALRKGGYKAQQIFFGADSSGCNLALATLMMLRDEGERPAASFFVSPSVDLTLAGESMRTRKDVDPLVSEDVLTHCAKLYAGGHDLRAPAISPLFGDLSGLPNLLIQVGNDEILLSDSVRLHEGILEAGGNATLNVWDEMWHVWHAFPELPEAQEALEDICGFLEPYFEANRGAP